MPAHAEGVPSTDKFLMRKPFGRNIMAPKVNLSGPARKALVADLITSLSKLQEDGGLSTFARMGVAMLNGWLMQEHSRLEAKYPTFLNDR